MALPPYDPNFKFAFSLGTIAKHQDYGKIATLEHTHKST